MGRIQEKGVNLMDYPFSLIFIWGTEEEKKAFKEKHQREFQQELENKWE